MFFFNNKLFSRCQALLSTTETTHLSDENCLARFSGDVACFQNLQTENEIAVTKSKGEIKGLNENTTYFSSVRDSTPSFPFHFSQQLKMFSSGSVITLAITATPTFKPPKIVFIPFQLNLDARNLRTLLTSQILLGTYICISRPRQISTSYDVSKSLNSTHTRLI